MTLNERFLLTVLLVGGLVAGGGCSSDKQETADAPHAQPESFGAAMIAPDTSTFFPLLEGSYWIYDEILEGEVQEGGRLRYEVIAVQRGDSECVATVLEWYGDTPPDTVMYRCDRQGLVWQRGFLDTGFAPYTRLLPKAGDRIGDLTFYPCAADSVNCFMLQNFVFDQAEYDQQLEWEGSVFERGIGLTSFGGSEVTMRLVEHRIGGR